ncbi:MAG: ribonuclease HI family protein [Candidatus Bipolaricaulota bacterium]
MAGVTAAEVWLYCDGGSRGNPGPGAIGTLVLDGAGRELESFAACIGHTTNNQAEYTALIRGLELASRHSRGRLVCVLDSQLVVNQMSGLWRVRDSELRRLHNEAKKRAALFTSVAYRHVGRGDRRIKQVDRALNKALDGLG